MTIKQKILGSIEPVIIKSEFVSINTSKLKIFAKEILNIPIPSLENQPQYNGTQEKVVQYYFLIDSINFCFWQKKDKQRWLFLKDGEWINGYTAFSFAIKKAVEKNSLLLNAEYLSNLSFNEFTEIFKGKGELLLFKDRYDILKGNCQILIDKFKGEASNIVLEAKNDVNNLTELIIKYFPSFKDTAFYEGGEVFFLKRVQLFINDIYFALQNTGLGYFKNMNDLTIMADYKLPQLLQAKGVLEYRSELLNKIKNEELIDKGSNAEIEIRANTIYACELLAKELKKLDKEITSSQLDWILWGLVQNINFKIPYHKTITSFY